VLRRYQRLTPRLLPAGATVAGWVSFLPLDQRALSTAHEFCGLVTRNDENRTTRTFDYALRGASQKQPP